VPKNIYGVTKAAAEDLCQLFARNHSLRTIVLRTSRFFPEQDDNRAVREAYADANSKAGLMVRELDPTTEFAIGWSRRVAVITTAAASQPTLNGGTGRDTLEVSVRDAQDAAAYVAPGWKDDVTRTTFPNQWLRLTRNLGATTDVYTAYSSIDGAHWTQMVTWDPNLAGASNSFPSVVYVGLCTTAHITNSATPNTYTATAHYQNFGDFIALPILVATNSAPGQLTISWSPPGGNLYSSPTLGSGAVWTLVGAANPAVVSITGSAKFFQIRP